MDWIEATLHVAAFRVQRVLHIWRYNNFVAEKREEAVVAEWRRRERLVAGHLGLAEAQMTTPSSLFLLSVCRLSLRFPPFSPLSLCSAWFLVFPFVFHVLSRGPSVCLMSVSVSVVRAVFLCAVRCVLRRLRVMCCMRCDAALLTLMFCCSLLPVTENPTMSHFSRHDRRGRTEEVRSRRDTRRGAGGQ